MCELIMMNPLAMALPAQAAVSDTSYVPGVWSLGETENCAVGPEWAYLADNFYDKVILPDKRQSAAGMWRYEIDATAYAQNHMPLPDMMELNEMKRLTGESRTPDTSVTRNCGGLSRMFDSCPTDGMKTPPRLAAS